ncbi:MAG: hydroxylase [Elusimicrobia bacterium RIFOXYD2_FULL_34_15]|nr:MAG: hydroxylase [Elusimicrobia bacterium RIFOXYD2_FULL_34_15]
MKLIIDTKEKKLTEVIDGKERSIELYSKEAFELISRQWLKVGWNQKYPYTFSWMGRPVIQLPEDMIRMQEVIYKVKPDVIIETGIAHGGSLIYYASLCKAMEKGRIIGVDIEIRAHNRKAIEKHELKPLITLIEGSSTDVKIVNQVKSLIKPNETVLVILDSNHTKKHVLSELEAYYSVVTKNSYIVATDGSMKYLYDVPRGKQEWITDNPVEAAKEFASKHSDFVIEQPMWIFNESELSENITHWPSSFLRKI